jgi:anti-sigma factor RsiW
MQCNEIRDLLSAQADREILLPEALEIERHIQTCQRCHAAYAEYIALRKALKEEVAYFKAPAHLKRRIRAALPSLDPNETPLRRQRWVWWNIATALVSVIAVAWSVGLTLTLPSADDRLSEEVIAGRVRSLQSGHMVEVASSDRHTVKPWFSGRLDFSPPVFDLTSEGFPLVGGRLDYLDHRPVAALVYRHRQHTIDLYVYPATDAKNDVPPTSLTKQGYHLAHFVHGGMIFWAISDVDATQISKFNETLIARIDVR